MTKEPIMVRLDRCSIMHDLKCNDLVNGRFWAAPISIFIATYAIPAYKREKIVHGLEIGVASLGHICFLVYHGKLKSVKSHNLKKV